MHSVSILQFQMQEDSSYEDTNVVLEPVVCDEEDRYVYSDVFNFVVLMLEGD